MAMPEDSKPKSFHSIEERLVYFTLPMSLNYQRNSYTLWESVLTSYQDLDVKEIFSIKYSASLSEEALREKLVKYKIALQPNKHIQTWHKISKTISENWGSIENLLEFCEQDFLKLQNIIQIEYKKGFPYLSGPKIFNYWCYILNTYCEAGLKNSQYIEIAPDTHVKQCSIKLGVITQKESEDITTQKISERWRKILDGTNIDPIDMHSPLWFWSRNDFKFKL